MRKVAHNLVRLGYSHSDVMQMDYDEMLEWLEEARKYNLETEGSDG